jgi:hypothetical protein
MKEIIRMNDRHFFCTYLESGIALIFVFENSKLKLDLSAGEIIYGYSEWEQLLGVTVRIPYKKRVLCATGKQTAIGRYTKQFAVDATFDDLPESEVAEIKKHIKEVVANVLKKEEEYQERGRRFWYNVTH